MAKTLKTTNDMDNIKGDIENLKNDILSLTKTLSTTGRVKAAGAKAKASENITHLQDYSRDQLKVVENEIKARPGQSMALALGAGLIAGFLLNRNK